jgi:hypothetical protein
MLTFTHREPYPTDQTVPVEVSFATGTRVPTCFEKLGYYDIYPYTIADDKAYILEDSSYLQEFSSKINSFTDYIDEISQDGQTLSSFMARFTVGFVMAINAAVGLTYPQPLGGAHYIEIDVVEECTPYMRIITFISSVILLTSADVQVQMPKAA